MSKFLYQIERKELEDKITLNLFYSDKNQEIVRFQKDLPYVIYLKKEDFENLEGDSDKIILTKNNLQDKIGNTIYKVEIKSKNIYEHLIKKLKENEKETYENDILPEHRYLIEEKEEICEDETSYSPLKYTSIDIETIDEKNPKVVMISSHSPFQENCSVVYINKENLKDEIKNKINCGEYKEFKTVFVENEKELLEKFKEDIINISPSIILGWNVIDFDFNVLRNRMKAHNIEFSFSKYNEEECRLRIFSNFFSESYMNCEGLLIFDVIHLLKTNFIEFEDYKLETVAKEILGEGKEIINEEETKLQSIEETLKKDPMKLAYYNFKDSKLVSEIVEKTNLMELMYKRSIITGTPLSKVKSPIATLDIMYLKKLHDKGIVAPSNRNFSESSPIEGAYVIEPKKGIYNNVFVFDFKSLYPSIIMTFNIDPYSQNENGEIIAPNDTRFKKDKGILPDLILKLFKEREKAKKENDTTKAFALKTTMNSFYGAVASPKSRFYNKDIGEAITSFGRKIIQKSKEHMESEGHNVVYGDTDSIFLQPKENFATFEEKKRYAKEIEKELNEFFNNWVKENFGMENKLTIELEKIFSKFFIASKKRYAGYEQITQKKDITGLEAIRGDWTELAQNFQISILEMVFANNSKEKIEEFIKKYVEELKNGKFDDKLIYRKKITKPLSEYTKTTPPHVKAAREVKNFSGRLVEYIITKEGPKHISLVDKNTSIDYEHYIEKQLKGVSDDILEVLNIDFDKITGKKKQTSLDNFF